ncbi:hypothetical protein IKH79_01410, partial [Candidatus Saccharibacteria bacterium]|nr:hypothetical protein [Candidatus Saccharibacteria bacterium]
TGFGPVIRRFESCRPSHNEIKTPVGLFFVSLLAVGEAGFEPGSPMPGELASDGALFHLLANCPEGLSCRPLLFMLFVL